MTDEPQGLPRLYLTAWLALIAITAIEVSLILVFQIGLPKGEAVLQIIQQSGGK